MYVLDFTEYELGKRETKINYSLSLEKNITYKINSSVSSWLFAEESLCVYYKHKYKYVFKYYEVITFVKKHLNI